MSIRRVLYNWVEFLSVPEYYKLQKFPFSASASLLCLSLYCFRTPSVIFKHHIRTPSDVISKHHIHTPSVIFKHQKHSRSSLWTFHLDIYCWLCANFNPDKSCLKILFFQFSVEASWCKYLAERLFSNLKKWRITFLVVTLFL